MTRRLPLAPLVVVPIAAAGAALWCSGLAWAIGVQVAAYLAPRPATAETEADWL